MYEEAKLAFENYISNYDLNDDLIRLKYYHTYKVVDLMAEIAYRFNLDKEHLELAKIIGLLHDIGRFEQIKKFNIISDKVTNTDYANESCVYLFDNGHIRDFIKDNKYDSIILKAIINHNKLKIENGLSSEELMYAKMIRDMDKIDIFRVLATNYTDSFNASQVTEEVLKSFSLHESVDNNLVKTDTDKTITRLSFIFDINYNESLDILVSTDNFDLYLATVDVDPNSEKLWKKLREVCFDTINKGVNSNE